MAGTGPNFTVIPEDWDHLEYIINYLCSRIINTDESFTDLLPLDGSRPMTGDLDMGTNDIINAGDITASGIITGGTLTDGTTSISGGNYTGVNSMLFNTSFTPGSEPEGLTWWNGTEHGLNISSGLGPVGQLPFENWILAKNETGVQIDDGMVVFMSGSSGGIPLVELAKADIPTTVDRTIGVATMDIPTGTIGIITDFGAVRNIDTQLCTAGNTLYVSATTAGGFTETQPVYPNFVMKIGSCQISDATVGKIEVNVVGQVEDILQNGWNGGFLETIRFTIASNGTTITGTLENTDNARDLTMNFSTGFEILDTTSSPVTVALTPGTDTAPSERFIYIPISTKTLTEGAAWPSEEHIKISTSIVQSATGTQTNEALGNRNWNNRVANDISIGQILTIAERLRAEHAKYESGIALTVTGDGTGTITLDTTAGTVYQLNLQAFPALDMAGADDIHLVNLVGSEYSTSVNLVADVTTLADGVTAIANNKYFNLVIWGVQNRTGEESHMMCNLPTGQYNSSLGGTTDSSKFSDHTIPSAFVGTGFLIAELTFQLTGGGTTWTLIQQKDLLGQTPTLVPGGGTTSSITIFSDSQFQLFDNLDDTKTTDFQLSSITTGNNRTITMADADVDLGWLDQSVISGATPTFTGTNITGVPAASILAGTFGTGAYVFDNTVSGITTLTSTSYITGGNIGVSGDTDLIQLAADEVTVNGDLIVSTDLLVVDGDNDTVTALATLFEVKSNTTADFTMFSTVSAALPVPGFVGRSSRGSVGSESATQTDDALFALGGRAHTGSAFETASPVLFAMRAAEIHDASNQGAYMEFDTTPIGSTTRATRLTIGDDGGIHMPAMKTGTTQGGAGAAAGELWSDTDDDNTVKLGV